MNDLFLEFKEKADYMFNFFKNEVSHIPKNPNEIEAGYFEGVFDAFTEELISLSKDYNTSSNGKMEKETNAYKKVLLTKFDALSNYS